jgi:hypothetical protein
MHWVHQKKLLYAKARAGRQHVQDFATVPTFNTYKSGPFMCEVYRLHRWNRAALQRLHQGLHRHKVQSQSHTLERANTWWIAQNEVLQRTRFVIPFVFYETSASLLAVDELYSGICISFTASLQPKTHVVQVGLILFLRLLFSFSRYTLQSRMQIREVQVTEERPDQRYHKDLQYFHD